MKALKVLMSLVAVAATLAITGCSKSSDNTLGDQGDPFSSIQSGWTESGNTCTYKKIVPISPVMSMDTKAETYYNLYYLFTIKFDDNDLCIYCKFELGCPNESFAKEVMAELENDSDITDYSGASDYLKYISRSGRILSVDISEQLAGYPKTMLKPLVEQIQIL